MIATDRLIFKYVMGAWLQFVYVSKGTFSSNILLLEFSFSLISSFSSLPTGKQTICRWSGKKLNEIKAGQSDAQTIWSVTAWEEANGVERKLKADQSISSTNHSSGQNGTYRLWADSSAQPWKRLILTLPYLWLNRDLFVENGYNNNNVFFLCHFCFGAQGPVHETK